MGPGPSQERSSEARGRYVMWLEVPHARIAHETSLRWRVGVSRLDRLYLFRWPRANGHVPCPRVHFEIPRRTGSHALGDRVPLRSRFGPDIYDADVSPAAS